MFVYLRITAGKLDWLLVRKGKQDYLFKASSILQALLCIPKTAIYRANCPLINGFYAEKSHNLPLE